MFDIPILFIIFKRPDTTSVVFEQIKKIKPKKLYIASDGPRNESDIEKCLQTKKIVENIDWPCEIKRNYSEKNLGCGRRVSSAIDWIFEKEEQAIILEDDCLPNKDFFLYCKQMLETYKGNEKIMMISGTNYLQQWKDKDVDYFF